MGMVVTNTMGMARMTTEGMGAMGAIIMTLLEVEVMEAEVAFGVACSDRGVVMGLVVMEAVGAVEVMAEVARMARKGFMSWSRYGVLLGICIVFCDFNE